MLLKKILLLLPLSLLMVLTTTAQKMNLYEKLWKKVDSLRNESGLTESALKEVNKIYELAKKEKNEPQLIKALMYRIALREVKEEDATATGLREYDSEIAATTGNARSILQSIAAQSYRQYFSQMQWQIRNRTATVNFKKDDVNTWSSEDFFKKISDLFIASLSDESKLQQTKLEPYDVLINQGNTRALRPTLFDLLGHRAVDFFGSEERYVSKPAYSFELDRPEAFADATTFVHTKFQSKDEEALQFRALQLYQRLIKFHLNDANPDALIDVNIKRLEFANRYAVMANKGPLYEDALKNFYTQYKSNPAAAQAGYLLALYYYSQFNTGDESPLEARGKANLRAVEILNQVLASDKRSEGNANAYNLLKQMQQPSIGITTEKVNVPNQPFRALVSYKNVSKLQGRIIQADSKIITLINENRWDDKYWSKLTDLPALKTFTQQLPKVDDYQDHTTEIPVAGLPPGEYLLLVTSNNFDLKSPLALQRFYVSNISYVENDNKFYVLNRETGEPLVRANVQVWNRYYDYKANKYQERKGENIFTDANGFFSIVRSKTREDNQYRLEITTSNDRLALQDYKYNGRYYPNEPSNKDIPVTFLFTDRAIYRPGQILYVKGILLSRNAESKRSSIVANKSTLLTLLDVNGQKVESIKVTTSGYGSYSARFTLPSNALNGQFSVTDSFSNSRTYINVEEYKRPKFAVEIAQPTGTYRLNENVTVEGTAKGYAGNNIDGATVSYRVVRRTIIPMYDFGWGYYPKIWPPNRGETMEIVHGSAKTDANGKFKVVFPALPDNSVDKKTQPRFNYEISADVTDISGEVRSGSTNVSVAYQALTLDINAPAELAADSIGSLQVLTQNLGGQFEKSNVTLTAYPLQIPQHQIRAPYWKAADQFALTEAEYHKLFPLDPYNEEYLPSKWARNASLINITEATNADGKFATGKIKLPAGWYAIEATAKDKYGEDVKATRYIQLTDGVKDVSPNFFVKISSNQQTLKPGQAIQYSIKHNTGKAFVIRETVRKDDNLKRDLFTAAQPAEQFTIPVTEADRGGIAIQTTVVKYNRVYTSSKMFDVPYTDKELQISYETYRDKVMPGSQEKWKVKISGAVPDKKTVELLTTMYDASLDQFQPHNWNYPSLYSSLNGIASWQSNDNFISVNGDRNNVEVPYTSFDKRYDELISVDADYNFGVAGGRPGDSKRYMMRKNAAAKEVAADGVAAVESIAPAPPASPAGAKAAGQFDSTQGTGEKAKEAGPAVRKNFNETAFFIPDLHADADGNIEFSFTMPEALTTWKWMSLAHSMDLSFGQSIKNVISQKDLMVQPNAPRFLREGDRIDFSAKIVNLSSKELTGQVKLQLIDPSTNQSVDGWFNNMMPNQYFTVAAGQSTPVSFTMLIPYQYNRPLSYRIVAEAKGETQTWTDGEEAILPVVSNRMLVTESLPIPMRGNGSKDFSFTKLIESGKSETLGQQSLTVEFTTNPAWYAVQSLPYLMEYPYECAEQIFNRYYANALATSIANAAPTLKATFERWKTADTSALLSNLQKNEELKSILLQETPWVMQANSEAQQKKQIGLLFDMVRMSKELNSNLKKLSDMQSPNGGFVWFKGGPDDRYITQYIATGIGRLRNLKAVATKGSEVDQIVKSIIPYLDRKIQEDYENLIKHKAKLTDNNTGYTQIQYLYMRSFFPEFAVPAKSQTAYNYFRKQTQQFWLKQNKYMQGMIAIALNRTGDKAVPKAIMASLKENAIVNPELGMYWKEATGPYQYYWYQAPIEKQALLIEAFKEVNNDIKSVEDLKLWLLKQKQTQNWRTTTATADACYALLLQGSNWLNNAPDVQIKLGNQTISSNQQNQEAGTGYFKSVIEGSKVKPEMGNIKVSVSNAANNAAPSWGAVYWQYFENLDKITHAATPLNIQKKLFVEKNTDRGPVLQPVNEGDILKVGDKVKVRIEIRVDRDMEYVHMKDMRASCMEPVNVLSEYKWQGGLGYYESTKDASTNFFFSYLRKGTWVFEYPMFVTNSGNFSNGITTIQCMYAPEFTSHSEGVKVVVEK
ncbi:alpha-2-macroglobulin [Pseudoflavitalea sp. G-6-1-2]|uniref:alpha-2-macroglobulin family protein n=1 Tax=Pseudoflavitalea sp. G-6-1-2 TaxID=2728841 RepID=UPI00146B1C11|nr:alpha-2-macroglobulin family protein [Pseudoflavitalea sp. G-6-1-2]NML22755.1 alpha-2-macroglobulin [Pseudoflavitalea sp. G-6-1-2]